MNVWLSDRVVDWEIARWNRASEFRRESKAPPNEIIQQKPPDYVLNVLVTHHPYDPKPRIGGLPLGINEAVGGGGKAGWISL
jgi:hypothetical protein